ncbi:hypothetical protein Kyoto57A_14760 [Helicobacter pylori]
MVKAMALLWRSGRGFYLEIKEEAKFVAQLLCDGGINKYDLTCAGLTPSVLADNLWSYGIRDEVYDDEGNVVAEGDEATALKLKNGE